MAMFKQNGHNEESIEDYIRRMTDKETIVMFICLVFYVRTRLDSLSSSQARIRLKKLPRTGLLTRL